MFEKVHNRFAPIISCKKCNKEFYAKPFLIKKGFGKYCAALCAHKDRKRGEVLPCYICKKDSYKTQKQIKGSKSGKYFCSKSCQAVWRNHEFIGPKHANWRHGKNVYRSVLTRNKIPKVCLRCSLTDERVLATHHLDKNRFNNKLENLVWLCHNCHFLVHHDIVERERFQLIIERMKASVEVESNMVAMV